MDLNINLQNGAGSGDVTININYPPVATATKKEKESNEPSIREPKEKLTRRPTSFFGSNPLKRLVKKLSPVLGSPQDPLGKFRFRENVQKILTSDKQKLPFTVDDLNNLDHIDDPPVSKHVRPLQISQFDFTDLLPTDETPYNQENRHSGHGGGPPPPPPSLGGPPPPPPPLGGPPPPPPGGLVPTTGKIGCPPPPPIGIIQKPNGSDSTKGKTIKLHWTVVNSFVQSSRETIWDNLPKSNPDTAHIRRVFTKKITETVKKTEQAPSIKKLDVIDGRRAMNINIMRSRLPPTKKVIADILAMDDTELKRDAIEQILEKLATEEELNKIRAAKDTKKGIPLGDAEQFLYDLATIKELPSRLHLWLFMADYEMREREIASALIELKEGINEIRESPTLKEVLSTMREIGMSLNGSKVMGFRLDFLCKLTDLKDTVDQKTLLHHLCRSVRETFPDSTDLVSELPATLRASKCNYVEVAHGIYQLEIECKLAYVRMKQIFKHDGNSNDTKTKTKLFLQDRFERIGMLETIFRRIINRYRSMLAWLGEPSNHIQNSLPQEMCQTISQFASQYSREYSQQTLGQKKIARPRARRLSSTPAADDSANQIFPSQQRRPSIINALTNMLNITDTKRDQRPRRRSSAAKQANCLRFK